MNAFRAMGITTAIKNNKKKYSPLLKKLRKIRKSIQSIRDNRIKIYKIYVHVKTEINKH